MVRARPSQVTGPLADDHRAAAGARGCSSVDFAFRTLQQPPTKRNPGGKVLIVDSRSFPVATRIAAGIVTVHPGGMREPHWHSNADEWQFFINGRSGWHDGLPDGRRRYVPLGAPHYVEDTGNTDLRVLEQFRSTLYQDVSLTEWLANTPPEVVETNLGIDKASQESCRK